MELREYQKQGYNDIFEGWKQHDILMFILATGGGKTVTFTEVMKTLTLQGKRSLLIAHRKELILQSWNTLYSNQLYSGIIMAKYPTNFDLQNQVASIQTLIQRKGLPPVDVLIFDESHHAQPDNSYGKIIKMFPEAKVLFVTATPYRLSGDGFEYVHSFKKTKLIVNRTLKQLTDTGWLVPIKYFVASLPDLDSISVKGGDYEEEAAQKAMEMAPLVESYMEHAKGLQGVCFCVNKAHSKKTMEQYLSAGVTAAHLDDETPAPIRARIFEDFKAREIQIICNVGIITEGVDMPDLEFVQLAAPTKSLSKYLQEVGRVTRTNGCLKGAPLDDSEASIADRKNRIKQSKKPCGLVLDNAGLYIDNGFPDAERDWEAYFRGVRKNKKPVDGMIEILIYIAEDDAGNRYRTNNPKEIEGLRLIEITKESKKKVFSITSIKEFDKIHSQVVRIRHIKKPAYVTFNQFMDNCRKKDVPVVQEMWDYMERKLITEIENKVNQIEQEFESSLEMFKDVTHKASKVEEVRAMGLSKRWFTIEYKKYKEQNPAAFSV